MSGKEALEGFYSALLDDDAEALYERAPCGYLSTTPDGAIVKVNRTFLTWTGYERDDLVGRRTFAELLTPGGRIYHETHYAPMLHMQGRARAIALEIVRPDGQRLPVLVNSVLERSPAGDPIVVRTAVFDATERRSYEEELLRAKQRAEESEARARLLVRTLQQMLIPAEPPDVPGLDVAACYRPAGTGDEVGGDFYDVFQVGPGDWVVAVGDVRGKGVDAAVVTALARYTIRAAAVRHPDPRQVLQTLNDVLLRDDTDRFCSVAVVRLRQNATTWTATLSCGGHPLPILRRHPEAPAAVGRHGMLIGVFETTNFHDAQILLRSGDALVLYTDGVTEARREREFFGESRLESVIARSTGPARSLTDSILDAVLRFQGGHPRDDIVVAAVGVP